MLFTIPRKSREQIQRVVDEKRSPGSSAQWRAGRDPSISILATQTTMRLFLAGICRAVWSSHCRVIRFVLYGLFKFLRASCRQTNVALQWMNPRNNHIAPKLESRPPNEREIPSHAEHTETLDLGGRWLEL